MMSHTRFAALTSMVLMLAASGCGGSGKSSSQAALPAQAKTSAQTASTVRKGPLTRAELIARANAICRGIIAKLNATRLGSQQEIANIIPGLASYERAALAEMGKLTPPASLAGDWRQVLASVRILADSHVKLADYAKSSSSQAFIKHEHALSSSDYTTRRPLLATARRAGFNECASI